MLRTRASLKAEETWKFMPEQSLTVASAASMHKGSVPSESHVVSFVNEGDEHLMLSNSSPELGGVGWWNVR